MFSVKKVKFWISPTVHFEADPEGHTIAHVKDDEKGEEEEIKGEKSVEDSMNEIVDAQKRQLDHWCFAEHYERKVLLQVKNKTKTEDIKYQTFEVQYNEYCIII